MRAIFIDIERPLESRLLDPVNMQGLGDMAISVQTKTTRPRREFSIKSWDTLLEQQMELIRNEIHAARAIAVFWLDGDKYADINEPMFVANGNGSQTEFPLPVNNVFPSSCKFWDNQTLKTDWTMISEPAVVSFTAAPTGRITFVGRRKFRVMQRNDNETLLAESQLYSNTTDGVYSFQPLNLIEVEGVNVA